MLIIIRAISNTCSQPPPPLPNIKTQLWYLFLMSVMKIIYLTSVLQFEMLTGSLPFQGKDRKETMALILK